MTMHITPNELRMSGSKYPGRVARKNAVRHTGTAVTMMPPSRPCAVSVRHQALQLGPPPDRLRDPIEHLCGATACLALERCHQAHVLELLAAHPAARRGRVPRRAERPGARRYRRGGARAWRARAHPRRPRRAHRRTSAQRASRRRRPGDCRRAGYSNFRRARARRGGRHNRADDHRRDQNKHREDRVAERDARRGRRVPCRRRSRARCVPANLEGRPRRHPRRTRPSDATAYPDAGASRCPGRRQASTASAAWADEASAVKSAIRASYGAAPRAQDKEGREADQECDQPGREREARVRAHERRARCPLRIGDGAERGEV